MPRAVAVNPATGTSWEGTGVKPDIAVPAAAALAKAQALAIERLRADASDPETRATLDAVAMKLEVIDEAASGRATHLTPAQIVGTYLPLGAPGVTVTILEKDGKLVQRVPGFPEATLVHLEGNRYHPEGVADAFVTSVRVKYGKTDLLLEGPSGPAILLQKQ